jgi:hypothetical protein
MYREVCLSLRVQPILPDVLSRGRSGPLRREPFAIAASTLGPEATAETRTLSKDKTTHDSTSRSHERQARGRS